MKRAYRTTWNGIVSIVAAESERHACKRTRFYLAFASRETKDSDIRVVRAPEWDEWAASDTSGCCWNEANLPKGSKHAG